MSHDCSVFADVTNIAWLLLFVCLFVLKVPDVTVETQAVINLQIKEGLSFQNKTTKILIKPRREVIIIETDKPIYKPGQTGNKK